jgi:hypothetical protein
MSDVNHGTGTAEQNVFANYFLSRVAAYDRFIGAATDHFASHYQKAPRSANIHVDLSHEDAFK